jgi:hypothetical protein
MPHAAKLYRPLIECYGMKECVGVEVHLHSFLNSTLNGCEYISHSARGGHPNTPDLVARSLASILTQVSKLQIVKQ